MHRDIKPANVVLKGNTLGNYCLALSVFSFSHTDENADQEEGAMSFLSNIEEQIVERMREKSILYTSSKFCGTIAYMSPEVHTQYAHSLLSISLW
mmetsp:Transcript_22652/g.57736  ORF Transcript_22652/g.57736 Transcript_22652/m.57736 type:complete len:95 (-) Transcript_22652:1587-1871(-)